MLFLAALPVAWTGIFDTTTTAFIIASAECDLRLTFFDKGVLCGFPFLGNLDLIGSYLLTVILLYHDSRDLERTQVWR